MLYSAALWAKNNYQSCNLPSVDDDDAQDVDDDDQDDENDDVMTRNINYVIGDVLQPQNPDDSDAIIVHCVGKDVQDAAEFLLFYLLTITPHYSYYYCHFTVIMQDCQAM